MTAETKITPEVTEIPFNKLIEATENVRKTRSETGIEALAASIAAEGLLQNLLVRPAKGGKYAVVAGERRRRALAVLVKKGERAKTDTVSCRIVQGAITSLSLAENIQREAMHPADQFEAWTKMLDDGMSVEDIATRHGASKRLIEQRLKLGRLSPVLLDAMRAGELDVEAATAFTVNEDHERQVAVYERLKGSWNGMNARQIKRVMTEGEIPSTDNRAKYVGRDEYERAGGAIREDLFGDDVFFVDAQLLQDLALAKLEAEAATLKADGGFAWVEITDANEWEASKGMRTLTPKSVPLAEEDAAERDRIAALLEQAEYGEVDLDEEEAERLEADLERIESKSRAFDPAESAIAGCFVKLTNNGVAEVYGPYIRPEDDPVAKAVKKELAAKSGGSAGLNAALRDDLAAIRLEILRIELLKHPDIASDLLAFHTLRKVLAELHYGRSPFEMTAHRPHERRTKSEKGDMGRFAGREDGEAIVGAIPLDWYDIEDIVESFDAFRALSDTDKTRLQAYAASIMLKPQLADDANPDATLEHAANLMGTDAATYWTPGREFFERTTKAYMLNTARTVVDTSFADNNAKGKKADLAFTMGVRVFLQSHEDKPAVTPEQAKRALAWVPEGMNTKPKLED